jgi:hypothetical protein
MIYRVGISSNTTDATSGTGTAYPSGAHEFIHGFSGVRVPPSFSVVFCRSLFVNFPLSVVLSVPLRHTSSDYLLLYRQTLLLCPLCCLFLFDIRLLITPLCVIKLFLLNKLVYHCVVCSSSTYVFWLPPFVSSNSSYWTSKSKTVRKTTIGFFFT